MKSYSGPGKCCRSPPCCMARERNGSHPLPDQKTKRRESTPQSSSYGVAAAKTSGYVGTRPSSSSLLARSACDRTGLVCVYVRFRVCASCLSLSLSLSLCFFVPSRAVSSAQVEVHMTSNKGNIAAECEILKTPVFTSIFHVFWLSTTLRLKQCYMFPVLRLRWPNLVRSCRQKVPSCGMLDLSLDLDFQADGFNLYLVRFGPSAAWGSLGVWAECHSGFDGHVAHIGLVLGSTSAPDAPTQDQVAHACPS